MRALCELGRHDEVREMWDSVPSLGLIPSPVTVAVFARSLAAQGLVDEVRNILGILLPYYPYTLELECIWAGYILVDFT